MKKKRVHKTEQNKDRYVETENGLMFRCYGCDALFNKKTPRKYCTNECHRTAFLVKEENKKPLGGYRPRAGRGAHGYYMDIWCDSTYEMAFVWWCKETGKNLTRNIASFNYIKTDGTSAKYFPDFIVDGGYVEVKGYWRENDHRKIKYFPYPITIIDGSKILKIVKMAQEALNTNNLSSLYSENYKPKLPKLCQLCDEEFIPKTTKVRFCSRSCATTSARSAVKIERGPCRKCGTKLAGRPEAVYCSRSCASLSLWQVRTRRSQSIKIPI